MKANLKTYGEKLLSKDSKVRRMAIDELAKAGGVKEIEFLVMTVFKNRPANGLELVIRAIGNLNNKNGISPLIEVYGNSNHVERELIMDCLLKLGTFSKFFPGEQARENIRERLWPLLFCETSAGLKELLGLSPEEFKKKLDFAWKITRHWRR